MTLRSHLFLGKHDATFPSLHHALVLVKRESTITGMLKLISGVIVPQVLSITNSGCVVDSCL